MIRRGVEEAGSARVGIVAAAVVVVLALAACDAPPVTWEPQHPVARESVESADSGDASARREALAVRGDSLATKALAPNDAAALQPCPGSIVVSTGRRGERYAAWWAVRRDSSALLLAAYSPDSAQGWVRALPVDTLDRSGRGCARPRPAIAADRVNGFAHVVYWLEAPEGPGVFYAHLMDPRARFEPPAVIVYGRTPAVASVASSGDVVAVAYEDPNRDRPQVELALSRTAGHLFEERALDVSGGDVEARDPRVTLAPGGRLTVRWTERGGPDAPAVTMERTGVLHTGNE